MPVAVAEAATTAPLMVPVGQASTVSGAAAGAVPATRTVEVKAVFDAITQAAAAPVVISSLPPEPCVIPVGKVPLNKFCRPTQYLPAGHNVM